MEFTGFTTLKDIKTGDNRRFPSEFICTEDHGPHHGYYGCAAHQRSEHWVFGRFVSWVGYETMRRRISNPYGTTYYPY